MEVDAKTQAELVDWVKSAAEKGGEFLEREAPLYAAEVIAWEFWSSIFFVCVFGVVAVLCFLISASAIYAANKIKDSEGQGFFAGVTVVSLLAGTLFFLGGTIPNGYYAVRAKVAPRVVLMEKLTSGMKR